MTGRRDARDDRPARSPRSKEENAARLADMATLSEPDPIEALFIQDKAKLAACRDEVVRLGTLLEECAAERDRLRVIVDLCVLEFETRAPSERWGSKERANVFDAHNAAMKAEVERRG